jgi:hypothetical protein
MLQNGDAPVMSRDSRLTHSVFPSQYTLLMRLFCQQLHHGPEVYSASKRNEYQESSCGVKGGRHLSPGTSFSSVSRLSRESGSLDVSETYGSPRIVTGIALLYGDSELPVRYKLDYKYYYK